MHRNSLTGERCFWKEVNILCLVRVISPLCSFLKTIRKITQCPRPDPQPAGRHSGHCHGNLGGSGLGVGLGRRAEGVGVGSGH